MATERARARRQKAFLEHFRQFGIVSLAAQAAGVGRRTVYDWRDQDPAFRASFEEAEAEAAGVLEAEAWRRAVKGVEQKRLVRLSKDEVYTEIRTEYSDKLLELLLKARDPKRFRETRAVELTGKDGAPLTGENDLARLSTDELRQRIRDAEAAAAAPA